jgi:hypothetical protein
MDRIMSFARSEGFSRAKAVVQVRGILEHEFEMRAQSQRG